MANDDQCRTFGASSIDLTEEDIMSAMKSIQGYIDITPADFKEIYGFAYRQALDRLSQSVTAEDIMTKSVIFVNPDTDLIETARRMAETGVSGVPVINDKQIVIGVISEKDFLRKMGAKDTGSFMGVVAECLSNKGCLAIPIREKSAKDIMTTPVITVLADTTVSELSKMLAENHINRIPVVNDEGNIRGIVSRGDLVASFCAKIF